MIFNRIFRVRLPQMRESILVIVYGGGTRRLVHEAQVPDDGGGGGWTRSGLDSRACAGASAGARREAGRERKGQGRRICPGSARADAHVSLRRHQRRSAVFVVRIVEGDQGEDSSVGGDATWAGRHA